MVDIHRAADIHTGNPHVVTDPEPLPTATRFLEISDAIWKQTGPDWVMTSWSLESPLPPIESRDEINCVVGGIDDCLVLAGADRTVTLPGYAPGQEVVLGPETFGAPTSVKVGTKNFDRTSGIGRFIEVDGELTGVSYTDGHLDYVRELFVGMVFEADNEANELRYTISRTEAEQDQTAKLGFKVLTSRLADMIYEGNQIIFVSLSEEQEASMLTLMQKIGGIILPEKPYM